MRRRRHHRRVERDRRGDGSRCSPVAAGAACSSPAARERLEAVAAEIDGEVEVCDVSDRASVDAAAARVARAAPGDRAPRAQRRHPGGGGFLELPPERIELVTRRELPRQRLGPARVSAAARGAVRRPTSSSWRRSRGRRCRSRPGRTRPRSTRSSRSPAASRYELEPRGIRMHAINPGPVPTEGFPQDKALASRFGRHLVVCPTRSRPRSCAPWTRTGARSSRRGSSGSRARRRASRRRRSAVSPRGPQPLARGLTRFPQARRREGRRLCD